MAERKGLPGASCVVVFRPEEKPSGSLTEMIRELAPMEENDLLAEDGSGRVLLIKAGEDPEEIEEVYRYFRLLIRNLDQKMAEKLWDAMTICQQRAAEIAFKDGYRMGYNLHKEMEVRR